MEDETIANLFWAGLLDLLAHLVAFVWACFWTLQSAKIAVQPCARQTWTADRFGFDNLDILKKEALKNLLKKCFQVKPLGYLGIALFGPFALAVIALLMSNILNKTPFDLSVLFKNKEFPQMTFVVFFIYNFVFFGFGKEVGWRGFALPRLQKDVNTLNSSLILTALWAIWHIPMFLYRPGFTTMGFGGTFAWLYNNTGGSVFIAAIFHATINVTYFLFPIQGSYYDPRVTGLIVAGLAATITVLFGSRTLIRARFVHASDLEESVSRAG